MLVMAITFGDIHFHLDPHYDNGISHGNTYLGSVAYADDIVIMSGTYQGLQTMLDKAGEYSKMWRIKFSQAKSKCLVFGETRQDNVRNMQQRSFHLGTGILEEVQHITHVGVTLCTYNKSNHRTQGVVNKSHGILASLVTAGVKPNGLHPIVINSIWNKCGITSLLYGSGLWIGTSKTEWLLLERAQTRKLKTFQALPWRTHNYIVRSLLKQPTMECMADKNKLFFLRQLVDTGSPKLVGQIFKERLYHAILFNGGGWIQDMVRTLHKYQLHHYLRVYVCGGHFPHKKAWNSIVRDSTTAYEIEHCIATLTEKGDVPRYVRVMKQRVYQKFHPYYTYSIKNKALWPLHRYVKLLCVPTGEYNCEMCDDEYNELAEHIIMSCRSLRAERDALWDDMVNEMEVSDFVNLWTREGSDILYSMMGTRWPPLSSPNCRTIFLAVMAKFYNAAKRNYRWLK